MRKIVLLFLLITPLLVISPGTTFSEQSAEFALVITIDGLRADAIAKANAPNLTDLIKEGSYTPSAKTVDPPKTLPSHTSLVTGLVPKKHLTFINEWIEDMGYVEFDTIFTLAKKEGFSTAMFVGKDKLNFIAVPKSIDKLEVVEYSPTSVKEISNSFISYMKENKPRMTLIHFPEPDITGHKQGWMSEEYLNALQRVDTELGNIINELKQAGIYEKTFLVITSDHGGKGKTHKGDHPDVTTIPWLAVGEGVKQDYSIKEKVYIYDTAPTVLKTLGISPPQNIDGRVLEEIFTQ
ncbi:MAG: ectonucleotide pyrophosphatase/phosphodiesterase [Candidatus Dadabacteria bacterium]